MIESTLKVAVGATRIAAYADVFFADLLDQRPTFCAVVAGLWAGRTWIFADISR